MNLMRKGLSRIVVAHIEVGYLKGEHLSMLVVPGSA
jgi:hypothetical protein